jgi:hypothetical protein
VRSVRVRLELGARARQNRIVHEGAQDFVVAAARLMRAGEDGVDDPWPARRTDALIRQAVARAHAAAGAGVLERAHDGRACRDDPPTIGLDVVNVGGRLRRNAIGLVERQAPIEVGIAGGGNARGQRQGGEADAAPAHRVD